MEGSSHITIYHFSGANAHDATCPTLVTAAWMTAVAITTLVLGILSYMGATSALVGINTTPLFIISGVFGIGAVVAVAIAAHRTRKTYPVLEFNDNSDVKKKQDNIEDNQGFFYRLKNCDIVYFATRTSANDAKRCKGSIANKEIIG